MKYIAKIANKHIRNIKLEIKILNRSNEIMKNRVKRNKNILKLSKDIKWIKKGE